MTRTATSRTVACGLAILLVGCATAPPPLAPPQLDAAAPAVWSARDDLGGSPDLRWWTDFDLPALNETVETALQQNYDLQAAAARLEQASADARIAAADLLPALQVGLRLSRAGLDCKRNSSTTTSGWFWTYMHHENFHTFI